MQTKVANVGQIDCPYTDPYPCMIISDLHWSSGPLLVEPDMSQL